MNDLLNAADLPLLHWLEIDIVLLANASPRRSHPLVVLEAVFKGVFEATRLDPRVVKQLWHCPGISVEDLNWQDGSRIALTVQIFGLDSTQIPQWLSQLHARFAPTSGQNFSLAEVGPFRVVHLPVASTDAAAFTLHFLTPVPLPHRPGAPNTALDGNGFLRLCQTRLRKLFGREGLLPPPPALDVSAWRYWRTEHRSRSQSGHPMFLNGCVGPLRLDGSVLSSWYPWLNLFAAVGLGERLSFAQGRMLLREVQALEAAATEPTPLLLRRPFVLDAGLRGSRLSLANANLVVSTDDDSCAPTRLPLMRLASIELHAPCQITSALLESCAQDGIPVLLATPGKAPLVITGHQTEARHYRTLAAHHAAWAGLDEARRARIAARLIDAKLASYIAVVHQRYAAGDHHLLSQIARARAALTQTERLPVVRGWEGWAAAHYYRWLSGHVTLLGNLTRRQHRGQTQDPINLSLNYAYALLRHRIGAAVRLAGLDPYLGILHEANGRHDALVSDLMEPYRPSIDRLVLRLINLKVLQMKDFVEEDGKLQITSDAKARIVQSFVRMLDGNPHQGGIELQARLQRTIGSYREAVQSDMLADWSPDPSTTSAVQSQDDT